MCRDDDMGGMPEGSAFTTGRLAVLQLCARSQNGRAEQKGDKKSRDEERNLPRMVRRMLMRRSAPQPRSRKTPRGGRMMARRILQMSLEARFC